MKFTQVIILLFAILLTGCIGNRAARLGDPEYMPSDWLTLRGNSWQIKELPQTYQNELSALQVKLANERLGQYYNFYGQYSPEIQQEIDSTISRLDTAYLGLAYSFKALRANLTPQMNGLSETYSENDAGIAVVNNENERMYDDDWRRALLLDKPSMLSPIPVVQD